MIRCYYASAARRSPTHVCAHETSRGRSASFPPYICRICIPQFLPAKLLGLCCSAHLPCFRLLHAIRMPQARRLPALSFRFHLTMDTLGVRLVAGVGRLRTRSGLSSPRYVPCPAHEKSFPKEACWIQTEVFQSPCRLQYS